MGADVSMQGAAYGECRERADHGWHLDAGDFVETPVLCGEWLVFRDGPAANRLDIRSFATGDLVSKRTYNRRPYFACAPDGALLVGGSQMEELTLPSLSRRWSRKVGPGHVREIAALHDHAAYILSGSSNVTFVRRR